MSEIKKSNKRRPGYPITINHNVEEVKNKIQVICDAHSISASALFEVVIDSLTDEQWELFAREVRARKVEKTRELREARLAKYAEEKAKS